MSPGPVPPWSPGWFAVATVTVERTRAGSTRTPDPFLYAAEALTDRANPEVAAIDAGAHDNDYWRRIFPDMLRFIGGHLT